MLIEKAYESLRAAELCFEAKLYNSTVNRAYYAMFQAAVVALTQAGIRPKGEQWSHESLHAMFSTVLIQQRKLYPHQIARFLPDALSLRHQADYRDRSVSETIARRVVRWSRDFLSMIERQPSNGT